MPRNDVVAYYDAHVAHKLRDFVHGNIRVDLAWEFIMRMSVPPQQVLEIGCGVGTTCYRASRRWPEARILGVDLSPESVRCAAKLFEGTNVTFRVDDLASPFAQGDNDLIVMMDVYEHVPVSERPTLHDRVRNALSPRGLVALTFPSQQHARWMRESAPRSLQPVDECVGPAEMQAFADAIGGRVLYYAEVDVWRTGDYAHALIGRDRALEPLSSTQSPRSLRTRVRDRLYPFEVKRRQRMVTQVLGAQALADQTPRQ